MLTVGGLVAKGDFILIERKVSKGTLCGNCGHPLTVEVYWKSGKIIKRIFCEKCGMEAWRE